MVARMKPYPDLRDNAFVIFERRYLLRNEQERVIETLDIMFERVSKDFTSANDLYNAGGTPRPKPRNSLK